jgi:hypothetical protein
MSGVRLPEGLSPSRVVWWLVRHPVALVLHRWNYKSAVMSALCRGPLFFAANAAAGPEAAAGAMLAEGLFRFATSGFYGAITQAFRTAEPARDAMLVALVVLPALGHSAELLLHWLRGTPALQASITASVALTCITTAFNVFAMRRGALIVGDGSASLTDDLRRLPGLMAAFVLSWRSKPFI